MLITRRIFLTSSSIQPAYKIPAKRHLKQSRSATKKKSAEQLARRLNDRGFALPFGPTRLADGLELEVFYATPIGITIRPGFRLAERWIPRVKSALALLQLRQTTVFNAANNTPQKCWMQSGLLACNK
jgi:hypothetical protein